MIRFEIKKYWRNRNFLLIFLFVIFCIGITFYQAVTGSGLLVQDTMTPFSDIDMKYLPTAPLLEKRTELVTQVEKINQKDALHDLRTLYSKSPPLLQVVCSICRKISECTFVF